MNTGFVRPAVATVLTVYGIETPYRFLARGLHHMVATVLTVYGIETYLLSSFGCHCSQRVATVLTVYGIETK